MSIRWRGRRSWRKCWRCERDGVWVEGYKDEWRVTKENGSVERKELLSEGLDRERRRGER